jgi:hypothetical protein
MALALSDDDNIIAASEDGYVCSVDSNGKLNWKTYIGPTHASPQVGADGAIYIANDNGAVFAPNRSGSQRWRSTVYEVNTLGHNAGVMGTSLLYVPSRSGLVAVSPSDGRVEWGTGGGTEQYGSVTQLADGTLLFGSRGYLTAANSRGDILWQYPQLTGEALQRNGPGSFFVTSGIAPGPDHQLFLGVGHN